MWLIRDADAENQKSGASMIATASMKVANFDLLPHHSNLLLGRCCMVYDICIAPPFEPDMGPLS
jgi:hypothetical protein